MHKFEGGTNKSIEKIRRHVPDQQKTERLYLDRDEAARC